MKKWLFLFAACASAALDAADVTGTVYHDANNNGLRDPGEKGVAEILISDGVQFARTDANGTYRFERKPKSKFVIAHQPTGWSLDTFYQLIPSDPAVCDFPMRKVAVADTVRFLQVTDVESTNFFFLPEIKKAAENFGVDFIINTGDLCRADGILAHAQGFTAKQMGIPVYYAVGNHDLEKPDADGKRYDDHLGPMWYTFEKNGVLFIAAPMYPNADFYTYIAHIFKEFPTMPKVVFCHEYHTMGNAYKSELPKQKGVFWNKQNIRGWFFGHWHNTMVDRRDDGIMTAYCCNAPNKGGIDFSPACFRINEINSKGNLTTDLRWAGIDSHLSAVTCQRNISAVAYSSIAETLDVWGGGLLSGTSTGFETQCKKINPFVWSHQKGGTLNKTTHVDLFGEFSDKRKNHIKSDITGYPSGIPAFSPVAGEWTNFLGSATHNGNILKNDIAALKLAWIATGPSENFMSSPIIYNGKVFIGTMDESNAEKGGVSAFDANTGKALWFFKTGYSVKNSLAAGEGRLYACDAHGNTYAVNPETGKEIWKVPGDESTFRCVVTGVIYDSGVVYSGARRMLKAINAATGEVLWRGKDNHGEVSINTLTVADGRLFTIANWRAFHAYDAKTGKALWTHNASDQRFQSGTPVVDSGELFYKGNKSLYKVDPANGNILLKKELGELHSGAAAVVAGDLVLCGGQAWLYAVDRATFEVRWKFKQTKTALIHSTPYKFGIAAFESTPVITGNTVWVTGSDGILYGLELATGKIRNSYDLGMSMFASPAVVGDNIFVADFAGRLFRFVKSN